MALQKEILKLIKEDRGKKMYKSLFDSYLKRNKFRLITSIFLNNIFNASKSHFLMIV